MNQVPTRVVEEKAEELLENLGDRLPHAASSHGTEKGLQLAIDAEVSQVPHKEAPSSSSGEHLLTDLNPVDDLLAFCPGNDIFLHVCLPPLGLAVFRTTYGSQPRYTTHFSPSGGIFYLRVDQVR